jgi:integrase
VDKQRRRGTGRIYKQRGCNLWTIQYYRDGKRIREATGLSNYQAARQKLNQRLHQVATRTLVEPHIERTRVEDLAEPFFRDQRTNKRSTSHSQRRWNKHLKPFFEFTRAADVGTDKLAEYLDKRMNEGAKNATINREIAVLRRMFRLAYYSKPQKVMSLPKFPRLKEDDARTGFVEPHQYDKLAAAASEMWLRAIFEVYHTYGWRKQEVISLRVRQVDFGANVIRLDVGSTKNDEGREVTMTASVRALLQESARGKDPDDFLFTRPDGKPVREFRKAWRNLCIAAGVGQMICRRCGNVVAGRKCEVCGVRELKYQGQIVHDLRRTAARNLRRAGVAEGVIMRIGGWKTRSVFERYNIVDQRDIREALVKLEQARGNEFGHKVGHNQEQGRSDDVVAKSRSVN